MVTATSLSIFSYVYVITEHWSEMTKTKNNLPRLVSEKYFCFSCVMSVTKVNIMVFTPKVPIEKVSTNKPQEAATQSDGAIFFVLYKIAKNGAKLKKKGSLIIIASDIKKKGIIDFLRIKNGLALFLQD